MAFLFNNELVHELLQTRVELKGSEYYDITSLRYAALNAMRSTLWFEDLNHSTQQRLFQLPQHRLSLD